MTQSIRRRYSAEFKEQVVALAETQGYSVAEAARHLDIHRTMLDRWRRQQSAFSQRSQSADAREQELRQLREENRRLREERTTLKKAALSSRGQRNTLIEELGRC